MDLVNVMLAWHFVALTAALAAGLVAGLPHVGGAP
jgi:hypothetical protein